MWDIILEIMCASTIIGILISVGVAWITTSKNRRINNTYDLHKEFYGIVSTQARLGCIEYLNEITEKKYLNFEYFARNYMEVKYSFHKKLNGLIDKIDGFSLLDKYKLENDLAKKNMDIYITLNTFATFYSKLRILIEKNEVDKEMIEKMFSYNYNKTWDRIRIKFQENTDNEMSKMLFKEVSLLKDDNVNTDCNIIKK